MADNENRPWYERMMVELDPDGIDESLKALMDKLGRAVDHGRYTRVRFKYKGKPLLPDIPLAALLATEVAAFWWAGPLRALVVTLGVKTLVEVEFVHAASEKVKEGQDLFMAGEVESAEARYREALRMKPDDAAALFNLGVLCRVTGRKDEARTLLKRAAEQADHPDAPRAREALERMG